MRAEGLLIDPAAATGADHVCWIYEDAGEPAEITRRYLELTGTSGVSRRMWRILGYDEFAGVTFRERPE